MVAIWFLVGAGVIFAIALGLTYKYDIKPQLLTKEYEEKTKNLFK